MHRSELVSIYLTFIIYLLSKTFITKSYIHCVYFIIFVTVVSIIISNIFVGLFLVCIDDLDMEQSEMKALDKCIKSNKSFPKYAIQQLKILKYKLLQNNNQRKKTKQQIKHIEFLFKHSQKRKI